MLGEMIGRELSQGFGGRWGLVVGCVIGYAIAWVLAKYHPDRQFITLMAVAAGAISGNLSRLFQDGLSPSWLLIPMSFGLFLLGLYVFQFIAINSSNNRS